MSARCGFRFAISLLVLLMVLLRPWGSQAQTQLVNANQVITGHVNACTTGPTGGTDTYACSLDRPITVLTTKACYSFVADVANSGTASINYQSLGAKTIVKMAGGIATPLADNDIRAGQIVVTCYDGTNMQMVSQLGNASTVTIASGSLALATSAIASGTCATAQTAPATGTLTTDVVMASFNGDVTGVAGYTPATTGTLRIDVWPTADTVNAKVCNATGASITPGSVTLNWHVVR